MEEEDLNIKLSNNTGVPDPADLIQPPLWQRGWSPSEQWETRFGNSEGKVIMVETDFINWEQRRYETAREVLSKVLIWHEHTDEINKVRSVKEAIELADELIKQLKKSNNETAM